LEINGISGQWEDGVLVSDWEGDLGRMDFDGLHQLIPNAIARLSTNLDPRNYNLLDMGPGADIFGEVYCGNGRVEEDEGISISTSVNSMSLAFFRQQLVVHFAIMFTRNFIKWPKNRKAQGIDRDKLFN
jgi:hypothetical protein